MRGEHSRGPVWRLRRWSAGWRRATAPRPLPADRLTDGLRDVASLLGVISVYAGTLELDPGRTAQDDEVRLIRRNAATALEQTRHLLDELAGTPPVTRTVRQRVRLVVVPATAVLIGAVAWYAAVGAQWAGDGAPRADRATPAAVEAPDATASATPLTAEADVSVADTRVDANTCGYRLAYTGRIRVPRGPVTVRYTWVRSDGAIGPQEVVDFPDAGPQSRVVRSGWELGGPAEVWQAIEIVAPVTAGSGPAVSKLAC